MNRNFSFELGQRDSHQFMTLRRCITTKWVEGVKLANADREQIQLLILVGVEDQDATVCDSDKSFLTDAGATVVDDDDNDHDSNFSFDLGQGEPSPTKKCASPLSQSCSHSSATSSK